ncbi:MAG: hypothetical protein FWF59_12760 [Turicibacter sp.]|nr:hypothetical protein [Turicibacter sp.]
MNNVNVYDKSEHVQSIYVAERFSQKNQSMYYVLVVEFKDGYVIDTFLNQDKKRIMETYGS